MNMQKLKTAIPVGDLGQYATLLVIIGITIGIGSLILITMYESDTVTPYTTYNETVALVNGSHTALTNARISVVTSVGNATRPWSSAEMQGINLTSNTSAAGIRANATWGNTTAVMKDMDYWVYYTYKDMATDAATSLDTANESVNVFGDWLVIIAIVIVAVVVLTLIKYL